MNDELGIKGKHGRPVFILLCLTIVLNSLFIIPSPVHAQWKVLSTPTGSCPNYLTATKWKNDDTNKKYTLDKVEMQCKKGMCFRCPPSATGTVDVKCELSRASIPTDIPCNYSIDDILGTALNVVRIIFGLTGAIALIMFVYGGFLWLTSGVSKDNVAKGKAIVTNSTIAIFIILGAGLIVSFVTKSLGGQIEDFGGATGTILLQNQCPAGVKDGDACKGGSDTTGNMVCECDKNTGEVCDQGGTCVTQCEYQTTYNEDYNGTDMQCMDSNLLTPAQKQTCQTDLCPGGANIKCCKI